MITKRKATNTGASMTKKLLVTMMMLAMCTPTNSMESPIIHDSSLSDYILRMEGRKEAAMEQAKYFPDNTENDDLRGRDAVILSVGPSSTHVYVNPKYNGVTADTYQFGTQTNDLDVRWTTSELRQEFDKLDTFLTDLRKQRGGKEFEIAVIGFAPNAQYQKCADGKMTPADTLMDEQMGPFYSNHVDGWDWVGGQAFAINVYPNYEGCQGVMEVLGLTLRTHVDPHNIVIESINSAVVPDDVSTVVPEDDQTVVSEDDQTVVSEDDQTVVSEDDQTVVPEDDQTVVSEDDQTVVSEDDRTGEVARQNNKRRSEASKRQRRKSTSAPDQVPYKDEQDAKKHLQQQVAHDQYRPNSQFGRDVREGKPNKEGMYKDAKLYRKPHSKPGFENGMSTVLKKSHPNHNRNGIRERIKKNKILGRKELSCHPKAFAAHVARIRARKQD